MTGEKVTAAQLLGEGEAELEEKTLEAERSLKALERKMRKVGLTKPKPFITNPNPPLSRRQWKNLNKPQKGKG
jgi:hypothetical protein